MPGEVPEEALGLVTGAQGKCPQRSREIEQGNHAGSRHDVPQPRGVDTVADGPGESINRLGDIYGATGDAERVDDQLSMLQALGVRGSIGHTYAEHVSSTQRLGREIGD